MSGLSSVSKICWSLLLLLSAGFFASYFLLNAKEDKALASPVAAAAVTLAPFKEGETATAGTQPRAAARRLSAVEQMAHTFYTAKNMRAFIEMAKKKPKEGGMSYAARGLLECETRMGWPASLAYDAKQDSALYAKRQAALKFSQYLCEGMLPAEVHHLQMSVMTTQAEEQGDVQNLAFRQMWAAIVEKDEAAIREQVGIWLAMKDPQLIEYFTQSIMLSQSGQKEVFWFEGETYSGTAINEIRSAISLAACSFGDRCDANDLRVATDCIEKSRCFDSRFEYLKNSVSKNNPETFKRVTDYTQRIVSAIQREDINAFIKPKK